MTDIGGKWLNLSKRTAYICLAQIATEQLAIAVEEVLTKVRFWKILALFKLRFRLDT